MIIPVIMSELLNLAERLGVASINKLPACWELQIDAHWWIAMNGHNYRIACSKGVEVNPFECYVEFNGFPAGSCGLNGGVIAAGSAANEDSFIAALRAHGRAT